MTLAARATNRVVQNLLEINKCCKSCIAAAYLRTLCNGWCTGRRFRSMKNATAATSCVFGCTAADDSIEHYAHCQIVKAFFRSAGVTPLTNGMDNFLMIDFKRSRSSLARQARALYAVYVSHCTLKHCREGLCAPRLLRTAFSRAAGR